MGVHLSIDDFGTGYSSPERAAAVPDRHAEDRPVVRAQRRDRPGRRHDRAHHHRDGPQPRPAGHRRGHRDRGAARLPAAQRLPVRPGPPVRRRRSRAPRSSSCCCGRPPANTRCCACRPEPAAARAARVGVNPKRRHVTARTSRARRTAARTVAASDSSTEQPSPAMYSIKAVSQATGLTVETLRAWERRYRIVVPQRDDLADASTARTTCCACGACARRPSAATRSAGSRADGRGRAGQPAARAERPPGARWPRRPPSSSASSSRRRGLFVRANASRR